MIIPDIAHLYKHLGAEPVWPWMVWDEAGVVLRTARLRKSSGATPPAGSGLETSEVFTSTVVRRRPPDRAAAGAVGRPLTNWKFVISWIRCCVLSGWPPIGADRPSSYRKGLLPSDRNR